jgi:hypothetical protein
LEEIPNETTMIKLKSILVESVVGSLAKNHDFFMQSSSPAFWSMVPFMDKQDTGADCSLVSSVIILNAIRHLENESDEILTPESVLSDTKLDKWKSSTEAGGDGVNLDELVNYLSKCVKFYKLNGWKVTAERDLDTLQTHLQEMQDDGNQFIIGNFNASMVYENGSGGHYSPFAAYDVDNGLVLVFDVDRNRYVPSWIPMDDMAKAMKSIDSDNGDERGYIVIQKS